MTVYVAFQGEYSDRACIGVFSSPEKAREAHFDVPDLDIEEHILDDQLEWSFGPVCSARIELPSGETAAGSGWEPWERKRHPTRCEVSIGDSRIWVNSPVSQDHAEKVAIEKRQEWLRSQPAAPLK